MGVLDLLNKTSKEKSPLELKEEFINEYSKEARENRERAVAQAEKENRPLSADEVMKLRKIEDQKRLEALKIYKGKDI